MYYCICLIIQEVVIVAPNDHYSCPKAYVLMSRQPFFSLFIDILSQILQIYKYELVENSKMLALKNFEQTIGSVDVSFSVQVENDIKAAGKIPVMIPQV